MTSQVDAVVVGAGPAGSAAALALARAGRSVVMVERGPFPGSKNVYGGVVYARVLDSVIPRWWEQVPVQRWVVRRSTMVMSGTQSVSVDVRSQDWAGPPYNGMTVYRADFDSWLADHAVAAGAKLITSTVATGLLRDGAGRVIGVRTDRPGGDLPAQVVIACDGVNSFLAKEAGLLPKADAAHHTLGVKEVLSLPPQAIEERFGLGADEGLDVEMIGCTRGIPGGGFLYTNRDTVSVGVVVSLSGLTATKVRPEELIADLKEHPSVAPWLRSATVKEYSAHLIPEGGYDVMPTLAADGLLVAGDAAGMTLAAGIWLEGVNFAIGAGLAARAHGGGRGGRRGRQRRAGRVPSSPRVQLRPGRPQAPAPSSEPDPVGTDADQVHRAAVRSGRAALHRQQPRPQAGSGQAVPSLRQDARNPVARSRARRRRDPEGFSVTGSPTRWPSLSFEDRMATVEFRVGQRAHITVDSDVCRSCTTKECVTACPANLFAPTADGGILAGSTTSSASSAGPVTWSATVKVPSTGPTPTAATVWCSAMAERRLAVACLSPTDLRPEVDPLSGQVHADGRLLRPAGMEAAALEYALQAGEAWDARVLAIAAGGPSVNEALRQAVQLGASALRVPWPQPEIEHHPSGGPRRVEAADLAGDPAGLGYAISSAILTEGSPDLVICGDRSADRGVGAVPAYIAHHLGAAQALGLVSFSFDTASQPCPGGASPRRRVAGDPSDRTAGGVLGGGRRNQTPPGLPSIGIERVGSGDPRGLRGGGRPAGPGRDPSPVPARHPGRQPTGRRPPPAAQGPDRGSDGPRAAADRRPVDASVAADELLDFLERRGFGPLR